MARLKWLPAATYEMEGPLSSLPKGTARAHAVAQTGLALSAEQRQQACGEVCQRSSPRLCAPRVGVATISAFLGAPGPHAPCLQLPQAWRRQP